MITLNFSNIFKIGVVRQKNEHTMPQNTRQSKEERQISGIDIIKYHT